jgi:hypothetical protein
MENIKLILFNSKKTSAKTTRITVRNKRSTIPPSTLLKNTFSALFIPLLIEAMPIAAFEEVMKYATRIDLILSDETKLST